MRIPAPGAPRYPDGVPAAAPHPFPSCVPVVIGPAGPRVLVCDEAAFVRALISEILSGAGFEIVGEARTGTEAVARYRELRPGLVTIDVVMPELSGIDALRRIAAEDPGARLLVCSAMRRPEIVKEAAVAGAQAFVTKPFQPAALIEAAGRVAG